MTAARHKWICQLVNIIIMVTKWKHDPHSWDDFLLEMARFTLMWELPICLGFFLLTAYCWRAPTCLWDAFSFAAVQKHELWMVSNYSESKKSYHCSYLPLPLKTVLKVGLSEMPGRSGFTTAAVLNTSAHVWIDGQQQTWQPPVWRPYP